MRQEIWLQRILSWRYERISVEIWRFERRQQSSSHKKLHWSVLTDSCYLIFSKLLVTCKTQQMNRNSEFKCTLVLVHLPHRTHKALKKEIMTVSYSHKARNLCFDFIKTSVLLRRSFLIITSSCDTCAIPHKKTTAPKLRQVFLLFDNYLQEKVMP